MNVDEILADPAKALNLPTGALPTHIIIVAEYLEPGADNEPRAARLTYEADDELSSWTGKGMLYAVFDWIGDNEQP